MKLKYLRKMKKNNKIFYYFDVPLSNPRQLVPLGSNWLQALQKYTQLTDPPNVITTFNDCAMSYFQSSFFKDKKPRTKKDYISYLPKLLEPKAFNNRDINSIQPKHITQYLQLHKNTPTQANRNIALFSVIFNYSRASGFTSNTNPCLGITKHSLKPRKRFVTPNEFQKFVSCIDDEIFKHEILLISLIGLRSADSLSLKFTHFDEHENLLRVFISKLDIFINFEVSPKLHEILTFLKNNSKTQYYFTHTNYDTFYNLFKKYRKLSGLPNFTIHDLRAMSATNYYKLYGLEFTRQFLGHSSSHTTQIYLRDKIGLTVKSL